jgi:hypothetical protein
LQRTIEKDYKVSTVPINVMDVCRGRVDALLQTLGAPRILRQLADAHGFPEGCVIQPLHVRVSLDGLLVRVKRTA